MQREKQLFEQRMATITDTDDSLEPSLAGPSSTGNSSDETEETSSSAIHGDDEGKSFMLARQISD